MAKSPEELAHLEWIGYVQPVGLVVSIPAMLAAQAHINRNILPDHQRFLACLPRDKDNQVIPELRDFAEFTRTVLGWRESDLEAVVPGDAKYASLEVVLPEYHETLRPTHVVREYEPKDPEQPWMMLVQLVPAVAALDEVATHDNRNWEASPQAKFERLLRETRVPIGLLVNNTHIRLVYAPRGETSGYATFSVSEMAQVAGRPVFAALHMLLCEERLFSLGEKQRLPAILADSRKYQNVVSTQLAEQVLAALYELVRGFQAADDQSKGELLREILAENPNHVYQGLLTVLMRLVFVLYAEDRGLLSSDAVFANYYSITGLFERLRADDGRNPDTMNQRFGAWAQLLTLFRLIYDGGSHGEFKIPARQGYLFDPDRYNFLEGRPWKTPRRHGETAKVPRVADGVIFRVLSNLLILDGERLSYRTLDVEQIGSVYETMMGFDLQVAEGRSIAVKPKKSHGAPTTINLEELLTTKSSERGKWLKAKAEQELTGQALTALKDATTITELLTALDRKIAKLVTPNVVSKGAMVLQPSDERRRSGSHYTPRSLTEPIVRTTLRPVLEQLGEKPKPEQILDLKVCDPAMGSGAFLVEACRQLGDELVKAWHVHNCVPKLPPDEDEILHARRLIAQRCLYGVDRNPMAVDLSKLSLWLATLAKDHPFTFLDHSLRTGDSLVGLTREQIAGFHWQPDEQMEFLSKSLKSQIERATEFRRKILAAREDVPYADHQQALAVADEALDRIRRIGDLIVAAFFSSERNRARQTKRNEYFQLINEVQGPSGRGEVIEQWLKIVSGLSSGPHLLRPFHWQIEFPEVFKVNANGKQVGGFDTIVGNPPFLGGTRISTVHGATYFHWLKLFFPPAGHLCDIVAYFFRNTFQLLRTASALGMVATNTVCQGDTRNGGLTFICDSAGGSIYSATRRYRWPGVSVIVSVVHIFKGTYKGDRTLDGVIVPQITAFLLHSGVNSDPERLAGRNELFSKGTQIYGQGFLFDDDDDEASPLDLMTRLLAENPRLKTRILPYLGGSEVNQRSDHAHHRYAIYLSDLREEQELEEWPQLAQIVREKVKPRRDSLPNNHNNLPLKRRWWAYQAHRPTLYAAMKDMDRVLVASQVMPQFSFAFCPTDVIFSHKNNVFLLSKYCEFACMQSRPHEVWSRTFSGTSMDLLNYAPSDCFETFPFPAEWRDHEGLNRSGEVYYQHRAQLMIALNEGLTDIYNRFHDPNERLPEVVELRTLHAEMDRTMLEAFAWHDLAKIASCEFLLDYEDDAEEVEANGRAPRRRKPWRYRWPDDFRDEVLARLLELNKQRAEQERLCGLAAASETQAKAKKKATAAKSSRKKPRKATTVPSTTGDGLFERERERFYILMLLRAWEKALTRHALDAALILMLNDDLRAGLLGTAKRAVESKTARIVEGLDYVLQELESLGYIEIDNSGPQQVLTIRPNAPATDNAPEEDWTRINEVKEYFERERKGGNVTDSEEHIDAKPDLVSAR